MGLVDTLQGLNLIINRLKAARVDFIVGGPINLWFRGIYKQPSPIFSVFVSDREDNKDLAVKALSIRMKKNCWPELFSHIESNRVLSGVIDGKYTVALASEPLKISGNNKEYYISEIAQKSYIVIFDNYPLRLAPLWLENLGGSLYE